MLIGLQPARHRYRPVFDVVIHGNKTTGPKWRIYSKTVITCELVRDFVIRKIVPCNKGFTKFQLNLPYFGSDTVLRILEIRHYGPVCDVSETGLYENI